MFYKFEDRPAYTKQVNQNGIIEFDKFILTINKNSCNIKLKKGGISTMDKIEELQRLIESYKEDLVEATEARDKIVSEDVQAKIQEALNIERDKIEAKVKEDHDKSIAEATQTVNLMTRIIERKESKLAELIAESSAESNEIYNEGV